MDVSNRSTDSASTTPSATRWWPRYMTKDELCPPLFGVKHAGPPAIPWRVEPGSPSSTVPILVGGHLPLLDRRSGGIAAAAASSYRVQGAKAACQQDSGQRREVGGPAPGEGEPSLVRGDLLRRNRDRRR